MTMCGESSTQVSWWCIIVGPAELVNPSIVRMTWTTLPAVLGRMAESQINMTPECLVCWHIFGKPGNVTKDRIPTAFYEIRHQAETGTRCDLGVPEYL